MNLRYKNANGKNVFCHTLNNTVIASPRVLIPILELNQNADGSITIEFTGNRIDIVALTALRASFIVSPAFSASLAVSSVLFMRITSFRA